MTGSFVLASVFFGYVKPRTQVLAIAARTRVEGNRILIISVKICLITDIHSEVLLYGNDLKKALQ